MSLAEGDRVLLLDRREPLTVGERVDEDVPRDEGTIRVVAERHLHGPRGGDYRLELTASGRVRARLGQASFVPARTVRDLRRVE